MKIVRWAKEISKSLFYGDDETPRILRYIYDLVDEDLDNSSGSSTGLK
jgi:hypothetical protein